MLPQIYEKTKVEPNKIILELNGKKVETLSDKQIFNENEKKKMLVKFDDGEEIQFLNKEYNIKFILVNFETREVDEIDSKLSRYKVSFMHTLVWNDERITELGRKVFDKASLISEKNQNKLNLLDKFNSSTSKEHDFCTKIMNNRWFELTVKQEGIFHLFNPSAPAGDLKATA